MAETKIEWADYTFNPWIGCQKVAAGCTNCYAESFANRYGKAQWGAHGTRVKTSAVNWKKPLKWNREAESAGERRRVFCASLADVFEDWKGPILSHRGERISHVEGACEIVETLDAVRRDLFKLIDATPWLDWLLLTKRPENIRRMWQWSRHSYVANDDQRHDYRPNIWLGTSVATQADADRNIPHLLECRDLAPVLFLSCEPLVEAVNLRTGIYSMPPDGKRKLGTTLEGIDLVIVGGESGHNARPMHPQWVRNLKDQCQATKTAYFLKQWGEWAPYSASCIANGWTRTRVDDDKVYGSLHAHDFPDDHYKEIPLFDGRSFETRFIDPNHECLVKVGKKAAGRLLDGQEYSQFPEVSHGR